MSSRALLFCCALLPLPAFAWGPVVEGGANITLLRPQSSTNFVGPVARAGMEIGERFNHALVFEFTQGNGYTLPTFDPNRVPDPFVSRRLIPVRVQTFAGRYTFSAWTWGCRPTVGSSACSRPLASRTASEVQPRLDLRLVGRATEDDMRRACGFGRAR